MLKKEFNGREKEPEELSLEDLNEEELDIVLNEQEPEFLRGQTSKTGVYLSPVPLVREQEGTLQREAQTAQQLARERKGQKDEAARAVIEALEGDFNKIADDPVASGEPILVGHLMALAHKELREKASDPANFKARKPEDKDDLGPRVGL